MEERRKRSIEPKAKLSEADLKNTSALSTILRKGKIKLLKASWLVEHAGKGTLKTLNRKTLEEAHPDAFADDRMTQRCLREVEASAEKTWCTYPSLVLLSYCWQTALHPDPDGFLVAMIAEYLNWYAAQRARYSKLRLYWGEAMKDTTFGVDFCVFIDFWSLNLSPKSPEEGGSLLFAKKAMSVLYGHRASTTMVVSEGPEEFKESSEFASRGGHKGRGWCVFEHTVSSLWKNPGHCMDMVGFGEMVAKAGGEASQSFQVPFPQHTEKTLSSLALDDRNGGVDGGSCLEPLVKGRQMPPMSASDLEKTLIFLPWGHKADATTCAEGYQEVLTAQLGSRARMSVNGVGHWGGREWRQLGATMQHMIAMTDMWLQDCSLGDEGMEAFAEAMHRSCAPQLEVLHLGGSGVGQRGSVALAKALARGALPGLRLVGGIRDGVSDAGQIDEAAGTGMSVAYAGEMLTISRAPRQRHPAAQGVQVTRMPSSKPPPEGAQRGGERVEREVSPTEVAFQERAGSAAALEWDLLKPPPAAAAGPEGGAAAPSGGGKEEWVGMAMDRPTRMGSSTEIVGGCKCCAVS